MHNPLHCKPGLRPVCVTDLVTDRFAPGINGDKTGLKCFLKGGLCYLGRPDDFKNRRNS
jgi:hypothetical protein